MESRQNMVRRGTMLVAHVGSSVLSLGTSVLALDLRGAVRGLGADLGLGKKIVSGEADQAAPELLGMEEGDWDLLRRTPTAALSALEAWAAVPRDKDVDLLTFRRAARVMTVASAAAYAEQRDVERLVGTQWAVAEIASHDTAQALVLRSGDVGVVSFRGTEMPEGKYSREFVPDWARNLDFWRDRVDAPGQGRIHGGFLEAWRLLKNDVLRLLGGVHRVYVTGHSQGGGIALASLHDINHLGLLAGTITVAAPKVGDVAFTSHVDDVVASPIVHLANTSANLGGVDPVVTLPPFAFYARPPGRLWKLQVGADPALLTTPQHDALVKASYILTFRNLLFSMLHWPGGRTGYLKALG